MKRISFLMLSLAVAAGCSSSSTGADDTESTDSEIVAKDPGSTCDDPPPPPPPPPPTEQTQCEAKGGRCTGLTPTACPEGFFADASEFSCGPGIGSGCCWACPVLSPPGPGFCDDGTVVPKTDEAGCARGFDCVR